jgi:uncharacterized membrane protein YfhO
VASNWANLTSLRIAKIPKDRYYQLYTENVEALQSSAVHLTSYSDEYMEGEFYTETAGILYLPIVNDQWYVSIDGEWQDLVTINDAFIGVYVEEGQHSIVIKHPLGTNWYIYGNDIKNIVLCAIIIILGTVWMNFKRKRGMSNERHISSSTGIE